MNNATSQVYAVEGSCHFIGPCATTSNAMMAAMVDSEDKRMLVHAGGGHAMIYGSVGRLLVNNKPAARLEPMAMPLDAVTSADSRAARAVPPA